MNAPLLGLCFLMASAPWSFASEGQATAPKEVTPPAASSTNEEQEVLSLSKDKWRWMSEKKADTLAALFDDNAIFVHMGGALRYGRTARLRDHGQRRVARGRRHPGRRMSVNVGSRNEWVCLLRW